MHSLQRLTIEENMFGCRTLGSLLDGRSGTDVLERSGSQLAGGLSVGMHGVVVRNVRNVRNAVHFKLSDDAYQFHLKVRHPLLGRGGLVKKYLA